jgi:hypothetical protein
LQLLKSQYGYCGAVGGCCYFLLQDTLVLTKPAVDAITVDVVPKLVVSEMNSYVSTTLQASI